MPSWFGGIARARRDRVGETCDEEVAYLRQRECIGVLAGAGCRSAAKRTALRLHRCAEPKISGVIPTGVGFRLGDR